MKKTALLILALSLLLTACGAEAKQPDEPEPAPQIDLISPTEPKPLTNMEVEKPETSQEALEAIFETVYLSAVDSHPEDWNVEFQITDEVGKITAALPEDVKAPADLRAIYIEWREAQTAQDMPEPPAPEAEEPAISEPPAELVAQQPTTSSNKGNSSGTTSQSQGSTSTQSDTSGSSDDWRQNMLTDLPNYNDVTNGDVTYNDPNAQRGNIGGSAPSTTDTDSTTTPAPSTNTDTGSSGGSTTDNSGYTTQYGFSVPPGHHVELNDRGYYILVNEETGRTSVLSGADMTGYVAGTGQITSDGGGLGEGMSWED